MRYATLTREESTDQGTFGRLETDSADLHFAQASYPGATKCFKVDAVLRLPPGTDTRDLQDAPRSFDGP
jgi:hypothetical protein